ncbi:MAG: response regulator [Deltaproteobacteria bacterium]|nr:response regulator [Deltaproteobacteria bacterium]
MPGSSRPPLRQAARELQRRALEWLVPGPLRTRHPDAHAPAAVSVLVATVVAPIASVTAAVRLLDGPRLQGLVMLVIAVAAVSAARLVRRGSVALGGNLLASVLFLVSLQAVYFRGGLERGAVPALGGAPLVAVFVAGARAGVAWTAVCGIAVGALGWLAAQGVHFVDRVPPGARAASGAAFSLGSLALFAGVALVYAWGRRQSQAQHSAMLVAFPDLLLRMSREGRLEDVHESPTVPFLGRGVVGEDVGAVLPAMADEIRDAAALAAESGTVQVFTGTLARGTADERHVEFRVARAGERDGEVLVMIRDQTEQQSLRRNVEHAASERAAALEEARLAREDRVMALGQLAAGVGHEINNPLSYITANLAYVRENIGGQSVDAPALRQALDEALEGARRVASIVTDLKTFARTEPVRLRSVDVTAVVDDALKMCGNQLRHRARVVRELGPVPAIHADAGRLLQVLINLLINAAHALPDGRAEENSVTVRTGTDPRGWAFLEVSDTGMGMTAEVLARALDPFFTTKPQGLGTGLGLSVSANLVKSCGGTLELSSVSGVGTTARIALPPGGLRAVSDAPPPPPLAAARSVRVLLVDDDALVRRSIARLLRGVEVVSLGSGREALDHLATDADFDVVLCDVMMPDITGVELREHLADAYPSLVSRFAFITGGAFSPETAAELRRSGAPILQKPVEPAELRRKVDEIAATAGRAEARAAGAADTRAGSAHSGIAALRSARTGTDV